MRKEEPEIIEAEFEIVNPDGSRTKPEAAPRDKAIEPPLRIFTRALLMLCLGLWAYNHPETRWVTFAHGLVWTAAVFMTLMALGTAQMKAEKRLPRRSKAQLAVEWLSAMMWVVTPIIMGWTVAAFWLLIAHLCILTLRSSR